MQGLLLIPWFRLEPIVFEVGSRQISVWPFRITVGLAFLIIMGAAVLFARHHHRSVHKTLDLAIAGSLFAIPFAVLFGLLQYHPASLALVWREPSRISDLPLSWSSYGAMVGGFIGAMLWKWRTKGSLFEIGDCFAFALPFGLAMARLGCFLVKDHPGRISHFALAVADYQTPFPPFAPRHDLGLYESLTSLGVALLLLALSRTPRKPGFYIGLVAVLLPLIRFLLDFLRAEYAEGGDARYQGLTLGQWVAGAIVLFGIAIARHVRKSPADAS